MEEADIDEIYNQFETARGDKRESGPPMYIVAPYDKNEVDEGGFLINDATMKAQKQISSWVPSTFSPEWVVVGRVVALAKRSHQFMMERLVQFDTTADWCAIFQESSTSFHSYNALLRVSPDFVVDHEASSTGVADLNPMTNEEGVLESSYTRSMKARVQGPKALRRKVYKNLLQQNASNGVGAAATHSILLSWNPIESLVFTLRSKYGRFALFFCNELAPEVIGLVWRPDVFKALSFSAMTAEYAMPLEADPSTWKNDSLVVRSTSDLLREMSEYFQGIVTTVKILDNGTTPSFTGGSSKRKREETG